MRAALALCVALIGCEGQPADPWTETRYTESFDVFPSIGRGFLRYAPLAAAGDLGWVRAGGDTLIYSPIRLDPTLDALPPGLEAALDAGFDQARRAELMVIARAVYNDGPGADGIAIDAPIERVRAHIAALEPIYRRNADVLRAVEAGFIGAWGEWHASSNRLDADAAARRTIVEDTIASLPPTIPVLVRTPAFKIDAVADGPLADRVGHHNDCFLSSDTDVGTYPAGELERWLDWLAEDTRSVLFGGETCALHARNTCDAAVNEMARLHVGFLNRDWHPDVIQRWHSDGCLDDIERRLGHRIVLDAARWPTWARPGERVVLSLDVRNVGFAPPRMAWSVRFALSTENGDAVTWTADVEPRDWVPGRHTVTTAVDLPDGIAPDNYGIWLSVESPMGDGMRLASDGIWHADAGRHRLGRLTITEN